MFDTVALPIRKENECDCLESPLARNLSVSIKRSASEIGCLDLHGLFFISGPTKASRCFQEDIQVNLQSEIGRKCSRH